MFTAQQSSKVTAVTHLLAARESLRHVPNLICIDGKARYKVHMCVNEIEDLLLRLVPNQPITGFDSRDPDASGYSREET